MNKKQTAVRAAAVLTALCLLNGCAAEPAALPEDGAGEIAISTAEAEPVETGTAIEIEADNWPDLLEDVYAELDLENRPWVRMASVPEGDPVFQRMVPGLSTLRQPDEWVMLAGIPEKEIVLYHNQHNNRTVFNRYGTHFQVF